MAERSTWPETHLNAVNKLLCWDSSFPGKATRPAATSHIPASFAVHLALHRERQVGNRKAALSDTAVGKKKKKKAGDWLSPIPPIDSSLPAKLPPPPPGAASESVQF